MIGKMVKIAGISTIAIILFMTVIFAAVISMIVGGGKAGKQADMNLLMDGLPDIITAEMVIGAVTSQEKYGVPAALILAQIIVESSGNKPGNLSGLAYDCKNLFGMKGVGPAGSKVYETVEYAPDGTKYIIKSRFRMYNAFNESIDDHGQLLTTNLYKTHTITASTTDDYARAIHKAGYATSPDYADMLIGVMGKYNLYRFDGMSLMDLKRGLKATGAASGSLLWPCSIRGTITSKFGPRPVPIAGASTHHNGIDIAGPSGTPILAADGGVVIHAGAYDKGGMAVIIDHGNGIKTDYQHLRSGDGIMVKVGQKVDKGQQIGKMGTTGNSSGNHLHFGVTKDGQFVNPLTYVKQS